MKKFKINDGYINISDIDFECPTCQKKYNDTNGKYFDRYNASPDFTTRIRCACGTPFYLTCDYKGDSVVFVNKITD